MATSSSRLQSAISAEIPGSPILALDYEYDDAGNIKKVTDGTRSEVTTYKYDDLDRLSEAVATQNGTVVYGRSYSYDQIGNITNVGVLTTVASNLK